MKPGSRRRISAGLTALLLATLAISATALPSSAEDQDAIPGTRPAGLAVRSAAAAAAAEDSSDGLQMVVNERGRISQSTSAVGTNAASSSLLVRKPTGATVRGAWMAYATRGFSGSQVIAPLTLAAQPVPITNELLNGIQSYNYFADVTEIVKPIVDGAEAGDLRIPVTEPDPYYVEGEILVVVFDDPAIEQDQSVTLMYGALAPGGDRYRVGLSEPIDLADPATKLEMSLGITFSYQRYGTQQYSYVDVNGRPLTTSAGGEDDGQSSNGALITVGGLGDSTSNPVDPNAYPTTARSDDELYDLRPFVRNGDRKIEVTTNNPSYDDNVMLATFTMNPPVTKIVSDKEQLVMLSFGDSYQSGEGAGSAYDDTVDYYNFAYENGENFPQRIGGQEDTLTPAVTSQTGNGCHRALRNYPKLVAGYLTGDNDVVHLDMTCSGAKVEPGEDKPPIVGTVAGGLIDPTSQVYGAVTRLATVGIQPEDVDVVTVGMGGNDAKFSDLVTACLIPTLSRELLSRYDRTPGLATWLSNRLSCHRLDLLKFHVSDAIDALAEKERFAQQKLRQTFPNADIVQLDYPGLLPDSDTAPAWCGGIGADDIDYADTMAGRINDVIRDTVSDAEADSAALDRRYELVEVAGAFGSNGLCPNDPSQAYANGISQANFDAEVDRLLYDPVIRPRLNATIDAYNDYMDCVARWTFFCDPQEPLDRFIANSQGLIDALGDQAESILPNIVKPPSSGEPEKVRLDRVNGLFHPNAAGIEVLACYAYNTLAYLGASFCPNGVNGRQALAQRSRAAVLVDDEVPSRAPIQVTGPGDVLDVALRGFRPGSQVDVRWGAESLDPFSVGDDGRVDTTVTLPAGAPGVHVLQFRGEGAAGTAYGRDIRVEYPGRPVGGESFATYITGFEPRPAYIESDYEPEDIEVSYLGRVLYLAQADPDGGLLVEVPVPFLRSTTAKAEIVARGLRSGIVRRVDLDPAPYAPALWSTAGSVSLSGTGASISGYVHSETDLFISGGGARLTGGAERVGELLVSGTPATIDPAATTTAAGSRFRTVRVAAFRPGGAQAASAGASYRAVPESACVDGVWKPRAADLQGVVYVPCSVQVSGAGLDRTVTIAAEGGIATSGSGLTLRPAGSSGATLVAGGPVRVAGSGTRLMGAVFAPDSEARISGSDARVWCGVTAASIKVSGARFSATVDERCLPD